MFASWILGRKRTLSSGRQMMGETSEKKKTTNLVGWSSAGAAEWRWWRPIQERHPIKTSAKRHSKFLCLCYGAGVWRIFVSSASSVVYMLPHSDSWYFSYLNVKLSRWRYRTHPARSACEMKILIRMVHTTFLLIIKLFRQNVVAVVCVVVVAVAGRSLIYIFIFLLSPTHLLSSEIEQRTLLANKRTQKKLPLTRPTTIVHI